MLQEMCPLNNSGGGAVLPSCTVQTFPRTCCTQQEGLIFQVKISPGCLRSSNIFLLTKTCMDWWMEENEDN